MTDFIIKKDLGGDLFIYHYVDEVIQTSITGITANAYTPYGGLLQGPTAITVAGDGKMVMPLTAANSGLSYEWARVDFAYTYDSVEYEKTIRFHIASNLFDINIQYVDIVKYQPDIGDYNWNAVNSDAKFSAQRDTALDKLYSLLINRDYLPFRVMNKDNLSEVLVHLWLSDIYFTLRKFPEDDFDLRSLDSRERAEQLFSRLDIIMAPDDTLNPGDEPQQAITQTRLVRG